MCGIAGLIHRGTTSDIGSEMTTMLQALKHRGPDSTGFAVYGDSKKRGSNEYVMRVKLCEQEEQQQQSYGIHAEINRRSEQIDSRLAEKNVKIISKEKATDHASRYVISHEGDSSELAMYLEDIDGVEILSMGSSLELVKDLGDATQVSSNYQLSGFQGTHGIGHTRMATESDVDIRSAHPYWAFPYNDISVVHNGQITNYWIMRREMERKGHRFMSHCDSELLAVYTADNLSQGMTLEDSLQSSIEEIDGVFTYLVATSDQLGMAKDTMAAKPLVMYESDDLIAVASEEVSIRAILPHEIDTYDPYDEEIRVWQA